MELALLVWGISALSKLTIIAGLSMIALFFWLLLCYLDNTPHKAYKWTYPTILALAVTIALIPSEKTAYVMVGAYAAQKIATDPKAEQVGAKVLVIINQELDKLVTKK